MPRCQSSQPVVVGPLDKLAILSLPRGGYGGYGGSSVLDRAVADRFFCARSVPLRNFPRPVYRSSTGGPEITTGLLAPAACTIFRTARELRIFPLDENFISPVASPEPRREQRVSKPRVQFNSGVCAVGR